MIRAADASDRTAEVAARRLADHLREIGWEANTVGPDDVPRLVTPKVRETWRALQRGDSDYVAAYRVNVDAALPETLEAIRSQPARASSTSPSGRSCSSEAIAASPARASRRGKPAHFARSWSSAATTTTPLPTSGYQHRPRASRLRSRA